MFAGFLILLRNQGIILNPPNDPQNRCMSYCPSTVTSLIITHRERWTISSTDLLNGSRVRIMNSRVIAFQPSFPDDPSKCDNPTDWTLPPVHANFRSLLFSSIYTIIWLGNTFFCVCAAIAVSQSPPLYTVAWTNTIIITQQKKIDWIEIITWASKFSCAILRFVVGQRPPNVVLLMNHEYIYDQLFLGCPKYVCWFFV